ncbi:uncharacterized protein LOC106880715 isoform X6 [Octopus bimaculoides]|uniref:uncharacterized protein LOC106880715 isoform X6 n=1 Tax=Octopus bimaculoides TaxID=37653 RepID=UPI00071CD92D|nr:uncharacterized protein LOC106880715 isoform X6 [Octopus bimaculoides]|eukprot:XP_014786281.1 PREDICTED: uncharacterized protein LOC106880715 isoform X4 [Octopus bimaculoides]
MLLAMMILMMASYSSAYVRIENIYPSKIINLGDNSGIIIECQYNVRNFKNLLLMKSYSKVVFKIDYDKEKDIYAKTIRKDGFDCTSINSNEGQIICWKLNPTCEDATTYTCSSATEFSKPKTLKEIEEERRGETNTIGSEQKELVEIDNADKLCDANIITKILTFATILFVIGNLL